MVEKVLYLIVDRKPTVTVTKGGKEICLQEHVASFNQALFSTVPTSPTRLIQFSVDQTFHHDPVIPENSFMVR